MQEASSKKLYEMRKNDLNVYASFYGMWCLLQESTQIEKYNRRALRQKSEAPHYRSRIMKEELQSCNIRLQKRPLQRSFRESLTWTGGTKVYKKQQRFILRFSYIKFPEEYTLNALFKSARCNVDVVTGRYSSQEKIAWNYK